MNLKGKFVRREGTLLIFGSTRKPEWRPMEVSGQLDYNQLKPDTWYELTLDDNSNTLVRFRELPPLRNASGGGPRAGGRVPQPKDPNLITRDSVMACATGFAKSAMESGICKSWMDAAEAGKAWAVLWKPDAFPQRPPEQVPRTVPPNPLPPDSPPLRLPSDEAPPPPDPVPGLDDEGWYS